MEIGDTVLVRLEERQTVEVMSSRNRLLKRPTTSRVVFLRGIVTGTVDNVPTLDSPARPGRQYLLVDLEKWGLVYLNADEVTEDTATEREVKISR